MMTQYHEKDGVCFYNEYIFLGVKPGTVEELKVYNNVEETVEYIKKHKISKLEISFPKWISIDLSFLSQLDEITDLSLWVLGEVDITPIYGMKNLRYVFYRGNEILDVGGIKSVEYLASYIELLTNLEEGTNIKTLSLSSLEKGKTYNDLSFLPPLENVDTLKLDYLKVRSLVGIERLKNIKCLLVWVCRSLNDISAIQHLKDLGYIDFAYLPRVANFECFKHLKKVSFIAMEKVPKFEDLTLLDEMNSLTDIVYDGVFASGNLTPLLRLTTVRLIKYKKDYYIIENGVKRLIKESELPNQRWEARNFGIPEWRNLIKRSLLRDTK